MAKLGSRCGGAYGGRLRTGFKPGQEPAPGSRPNLSDGVHRHERVRRPRELSRRQDRKSTRLNSSHVEISYAVFCLKKKNDRLLDLVGLCGNSAADQGKGNPDSLAAAFLDLNSW